MSLARLAYASCTKLRLVLLVPLARMARGTSMPWVLPLALASCRLDPPNAEEYGGPGTGSSSLDPESTGPEGVDSGSTGSGSTGSETSGDVITDSTGVEPESTSGTTSGTESSDTGVDPVCGDDVAGAGEPCDGMDLGGGSCESEGFDAGVLGCLDDCSAFDISGCVTFACGNGVLEGTEPCDGADLAGADCVGQGFDAGALGCLPDCSAFDISGCVTFACGNGVLDPDEECDEGGESPDCDSDCTFPECGDLLVNPVVGEACDGMDLGGASCQSEGFDGGMLACSAQCQLDSSACHVCGDGVVNGGEACDGASLGGATCTGLGFAGGPLACTADCSGFDTIGCYVCGNAVVDPGEQCDEAGSSPACDADCTVAECGDGTVNPVAGEACDTAGSSVTCDSDCTPPACGDGVVNPATGEQCDDGNGIDDDACSNACQLNACGVDVALLPLFVHPGNSYGEIDFDGDCNLIVSGCFNSNLYGISPAGVVSVFAPFPGIYSINGIAYRASDDVIYVTTDGPPELWAVSAAGVASLVMALPTTIDAIEVAPPGFAPYGDQLMGAGSNGSVYAIDPDAASTSVVGTTAGWLSSLVFDPAGSVVYVAAYGQSSVLQMDAAGTFAVVAGGFSGPDGLAISPFGTLFVAASSAPSVTAIDLATGVQNVIANPSLDGGTYVTGLLYEAGGHVLMKVQGANIDYATLF